MSGSGESDNVEVGGGLVLDEGKALLHADLCRLMQLEVGLGKDEP